MGDLEGRGAAAQRRIEAAARSVAQHGVEAGARADSQWDYRTGTVTATSPLTVQFPGEQALTGFHRLASYTPTINDVVLVLVRSPQATILGKVV